MLDDKLYHNEPRSSLVFCGSSNNNRLVTFLIHKMNMTLTPAIEPSLLTQSVLEGGYAHSQYD